MGHIIEFPDDKRAREKIQELKKTLEDLVFERDNLKFVICENIKTAYYDKKDKDKAIILFLIYFFSGILFLSIGEMPKVYMAVAVINIRLVMPFLLGLLIFLPSLFKRRGYFSYLLIFLFIPHLFWIYFLSSNYLFYLPLSLGLIISFYIKKTVKTQ